MQNALFHNIGNFLATSLVCAFVAFAHLPASSQSYLNVRFNDEASDTIKINSILSDPEVLNAPNPGDRMALIGKKFLGVPYKAHTLERVPEKLTVNCDSLDCTTFVETVLALGKTVGEERESWRDFVANLTSIRYRNGIVDGYPSRLHYISDWTVDNVRRDNFKEVTSQLPHVKYIVKTIDFMSRHRNSYPALADSLNFERVRSLEEGYHNHRYPYLKSRDLSQKDLQAELQNGDVIAFVTDMPELDVSHMGMLVKENGVLYVMHASMSGGKVEISSVPLVDFMRRNRSFVGIRVYRLLQ